MCGRQWKLVGLFKIVYVKNQVLRVLKQTGSEELGVEYRYRPPSWIENTFAHSATDGL